VTRPTPSRQSPRRRSRSGRPISSFGERRQGDSNLGLGVGGLHQYDGIHR
jgi:hypothetical protein